MRAQIHSKLMSYKDEDTFNLMLRRVSITMKLNVLFIIIFGIIVDVKAAVFKIDVTLFDASPLVASSPGSAEEFRAYVPWDSKSAVCDEIGRTGFTGTGAIGAGYDPPDDTNNAVIVPDGRGFPSGTSTGVKQNGGKNEYTRISFPNSQSNERVGVFYFETTLNSETVRISTVKISSTATINPTRYTKTVGVGDSVTLGVTTSLTNSLRWVHNDGPIKDEWNGLTDVTIDNVRVADAGIYECFEEGNRNDGQHSIMILIVKACPSGKYGSGCSLDCPTCYNGGICEADTGICVCPPGFEGTQCETSCGSNYWGATCDIFCSNSGNCRGKLMCPPDPIGCSCIAGFTGLNCETACSGSTAGNYGANCEQDCHCGNNCDGARGCRNIGCDAGYGGDNCQAPDVCEDGYFGELCNFRCHCESTSTCNKANGVCTIGTCEEGWAGNDCQQALPVLDIPPTVDNVNSLSFTMSWMTWDISRDYGTGPVEQYQIQCWESNVEIPDIGDPTSGLRTTITLPKPETLYECAVSAMRTIESELVGGPPGPRKSGTTGCGPPTVAPTIITNPEKGTDYVLLQWNVPTSDDWIQCSEGLEGFTITTSPTPDGISVLEEQTINITDPSIREYRVISLNPCTEYMFSIIARNKDASGPSDTLTTSTESVPPESPTELNTTTVSSSSLSVSWSESLHKCGLSDYVLQYQLVNYDQCDDSKNKPAMTLRTEGTNINIGSLEGYSTYSIYVIATLDDLNSTALEGTETTGIDVPTSPPVDLQSVPSVPRQLSFSWNQPPCGSRKGPITQYEYQFAETLDENNSEGNATILPSVDILGLKHFTEYEFRVAAHTSEGRGPYTNIIAVRTAESVPDHAPLNVQNDTSEQQMTFSWLPPPEESRNGIIQSYTYQFGEDLQNEEDTGIGTVDTLSKTFPELFSDTCYQFKVQASTSVGAGPFTDVLSVCTLKSDTGTSLNVTAVAIGASVGMLFVIIVIVILIVGARKRTAKKNDGITTHDDGPDHVDHDNPTYSNTGVYRISAHALNSTSGEKVNDTSQPPITKQKPQVGVTPINMINTSSVRYTVEKDQDDPHSAIKTTTPSSHMSYFKPSSKQSISVDQLIEYVRDRKLDAPDHELSMEYKSLSNAQLSPWTVASKEINEKKNRYTNIITYDHSRVILDPLKGDPDSDYINASYIDGYKKINAYIAAQGPNKQTILDFWRMIWQERTHTVVMTTNLKEGVKRKCEQYWPDRDKSIKYGDIRVKNENETILKSYTIRTFLIRKEEEVREIKQFHYTAWPDMNAPEFASPVLQFLDDVNAFNPRDAGPVVVHCSAGVGRTGTFLTIDTMRQMAESEGTIDVLGYVKHMRTRRPNMIQVQNQYVFVYEALLEALFCGDTTIATNDMEIFWNKLRKENSLLVGQFQCLQAMYPDMSDYNCTAGKDPKNVSKNRYPDCIPADSSRPYLMTTSDGSNYINATFYDGHTRPAMFLATQIPLPNTVVDFWAMIYDYQCCTVVTLNDPFEDDQTFGVFLPEEGVIACGPFTIELLDVGRHHCTIEKKLRLVKTDEKAVSIVTLIQYTDWTADCQIPKKTDSFVNLLDRIERSRRNSGDSRLAVMSMNGVDRCGVLCAMVSITDQIKDEQEIDVFRAVKRLKKTRYNAVHTLEEYKFCYDTSRTYLQSFEDYANFT